MLEQFSRKSGVELCDMRLFPNFELIESRVGNEFINCVTGSQVVLKIQVHMREQFSGLPEFAPIRDDQEAFEYFKK